MENITNEEPTTQQENEFTTEQDKYKNICEKLRTPVVTSYIRNMKNKELVIPYRGIGERGLRALVHSLRFNTTITYLNLSDNNLDEGSIRVS